MPIDRSIAEQNRAETARLRALVERLSEADLARSLGEGWTVATTLLHLAFWDRRAAILLDKWEKAGKPTPSLMDTDTINDALLFQGRLVPPRAAAAEWEAAAAAIDARLDSISDHLIAAIRDGNVPFMFDRANHRREHREEIEAAVS
jgi:hypothetical protein